jgi:hypothetical protein
MKTWDVTETVADSIEWIPGTRATVHRFLDGDIDLAQTVADSFGESHGSIDEVLDLGSGVGDSCQKVGDACQKVGDLCQRVRCIKRLRHLTSSMKSLTFWKGS